MRVLTTEGNTFYSHKLNKQSVWIIPEEIKSAVDELQTEERRRQETKLEKSTQDANSANSKRKAQTSLDGDEAAVNKRVKLEDDDDDDDDGDDDEESEEDWQRQAAAQLAAEAEEERKRVEAEAEKEKEAETQRARAAAEIIMPQKVDLSVEEGKALFKVSSIFRSSDSQKFDQGVDSVEREGH